VVRFTQYESLNPLLDCPRLAHEHGASAAEVALMVAQMPIACTYRSRYGGFVVVPVWAPDWLKEHEYEHMAGKAHPLFLPIAPECP
jgi:hypothetical protein